MIVIEVQLPRLRPCLKNTSRGFPNPLFGNLLSGEDQTVTNLLFTVKSNHNLFLGEDQTVTKSFYGWRSNYSQSSFGCRSNHYKSSLRWRVTIIFLQVKIKLFQIFLTVKSNHNLLTGEDQTVSTKDCCTK